GTIPLAHAPPGYCAFITQQIDLPASKVLQPHYAFLVNILVGVVADNAGWVRRPGRPWPEPWGGWDRAAERIWNSLDASERDAVIACGIRELSSLMTAPRGDQEIRRAIESVLGEKALARLAVLLRTREGEGTQR